MSAHTIQLSEDALLGEYVALEDFRGFLENRIAVSPDLMCMVIRNGEVVSADAGGNFSVGGVWRSVKDAFVGKHALRLLIADLKPFQLETGFRALSRDKVQVGGEVTIEFQVNPERPSGVLGLMREHSAVYKGEVLDRIAPHIDDRIFESVIGQMDAADLRGSTMVQDKIQAEVMKEAERIAGDLGLMVRAVSVRWEMNPEELAAIEDRDLARDQERKDAAHAALKREVERASEATALQVSTELDETKIRAASDDEMRRMLLDQELAFTDARDTGHRVQEMKALEHEIARMRTERVASIEASLETARGEIQAARLRAELLDVERDIRQLDTEQRLALQKLEQMQELEIARAAHETNMQKLGDLQDLDTRGRKSEVEIGNLEKDSDARRSLDAQMAADRAELEKLRTMKDMSPELVLAINAGVSPAVAEVLVEQAKAKAAGSTDKLALMREQIEMARQAKLESADQAREFFQAGMQGAVGVAQGAGGGKATAAPAQDSGAQQVECTNPECRKMIPVTSRFCQYCGQQMRS